jgi:SOS-response transcriptional repressor LexA
MFYNRPQSVVYASVSKCQECKIILHNILQIRLRFDIIYTMNEYQQKLYQLALAQDLGKLSLRQMAKLIGADNKPQIVKHHLIQLEKSGLIQLNLDQGVIKPIKKGFGGTSIQSPFYSLPIVGAANCGPATVFADERIEGYVKVSSKMLPRKKQSLYVLVADGPSMNRAEVRPGVTIDSGDFVVVDSAYQNPKNGDIVVAVIEGMATIKRYKEDKQNNQIVLEAESTEKFMPIFVHEGDDFVISGKVVEIIKNPKK